MERGTAYLESLLISLFFFSIEQLLTNFNMIRETIKEALLARNMTRKELARLAGCRINTITDFLNAKSEMRSDLLTKVFEIMKIKIGASDNSRQRGE